MAGTIPYSLSQQFDELGNVLAGGKLYFYQAGTTATPQNAYQDYGLSIPWPNPIVLDAAGRIPQFFLADGFIKVALFDANGVTQVTADNLLVVGPSSGSGGGGGVDATTILATGDIKTRYGTGTLSGFVRLNGRTIGSSTSGATEHAGADAQALFIYLYNTDPNLAVSGGRTGNALNDFNSNKTIALPDVRGRGIVGMDTMGAAAANRLINWLDGSVLGNAGGFEGIILNALQLPQHDHAVFLNDPGHAHTIKGTGTSYSNGGNPFVRPLSSDPGGNSGIVESATTGITISSVAGGGNLNKTATAGTGTEHNNLPPVITMCVYIKL